MSRDTYTRSTRPRRPDTLAPSAEDIIALRDISTNGLDCQSTTEWEDATMFKVAATTTLHASSFSTTLGNVKAAVFRNRRRATAISTTLCVSSQRRSTDTSLGMQLTNLSRMEIPTHSRTGLANSSQSRRRRLRQRRASITSALSSIVLVSVVSYSGR